MAADLDRGTISVGHNGKFRPIWQNISTPRKRGDPKDARVKIDGGLAPALSGSDGIVCTLNTGQKPWKYGPPHPDYKAFKDVAVPYKIAWDVEKTPAPASKEAKAALAAASAAAVAAAKFSRSIRAPSIHPQEWTTNVSKYIEARMKLEAETHIPKSKREETSVKSLVEGQVKMYDLPTPEDSTDCAWKIMKEFDTRIARVQVLSRMLMGSKDRVEIRGLRSGRVVLRFGLFPNKTEKDEFGIVRNCIKKYTMEVRVFARNMGLAPESPSHAKNADKVGKTQVETHTEALKAERQQLIAQEHRRRSLSAATAAHAKLDWISAFATSE